MISRSGMGKQLTGNRTKKMATGGKTNSGGSKSVSVSKSSKTATTSKATGREAAGTKSVGTFTKSGGASASKSNAAKGGAAPAAKSGGSAAGKTINTSSVKAGGRDGGGGMLSNITNAVRGAFAGNKKFTTVTDPKTGQSFAKPTYGALSFRGLTSNDPANVARNRAAAAKYAAMDAERNRIRNGRDNPGPAPVLKPDDKATKPTPTTPAAPTMLYVPAPVGYRPGIDPEHRFYQPQPPAAMKRGGKVKPKGKK